MNEKDSRGNSPLLVACRLGNFEIAEVLVVAGAGVSAANKRGDTPLLAAVGAGSSWLSSIAQKDSSTTTPCLHPIWSRLFGTHLGLKRG